jgi:hypothetical protein
MLVVSRSDHARTTGKSFLHLLRPNARSTSKIGVTSNRCELRRSSSEVVVRDWINTIIGESTARMERAMRGSGCIAMELRFAIRTCGFPVNRLHTILELCRRSKLPFAYKGPDDSYSSNTRSNCNNSNDGCVTGGRRIGSSRSGEGRRTRRRNVRVSYSLKLSCGVHSRRKHRVRSAQGGRRNRTWRGRRA